MIKAIIKKNITDNTHITGELVKAKEFYRKGKYKTAAKIFMDILTVKFNPEAACFLGKCYLYGRGVTRNTKTAFDLFKEASFTGFYPAFYCLAKFHENLYERKYFLNLMDTDSEISGYLRKKNEIISLLKKAAKNSHVESCYKLGQFYSYPPNIGSEPLSKSLEWYEKAAEKGYVKAMYELGFLYHNGNIFNIKKDYLKAAYWYKKAAEKGYVRAMRVLSWCYARGKGVKKDKNKAKYWRKKAKSQKTAFNKTRNLRVGDEIINTRTGEKEVILIKCQCHSYIQCARGTRSEENGFAVNTFGSHTYCRNRPDLPSNECNLSIPAEKAFADKFPEKDWEFI